MRRRGISMALLVVLALVPLAIILDVALLAVSFPDALELVLGIDIPILAAVGAVAFLSFRRQRKSAAQVRVAPSLSPQKIISNAVNHLDPKPPRTNPNLPESEAEAEEAGVFLGGKNTEQPAQGASDIFGRMKAKEDEDFGVRPVPGFEPRVRQATARALGEEPVEEMEKKPGEPESKGYSLTPDKLRAPAFICRCGHTHRFLCLQCGLNVETAVKKKKMHWVEWTPEMVETQ